LITQINYDTNQILAKSKEVNTY